MAQIAFLLKKYPKSSETFISNQINALEERGHNVDVYAQRETNESSATSLADPNDVNYFDPIGLRDIVISLFRTQLRAAAFHPGYPLRMIQHGTNAVTQADLWMRVADPLIAQLDEYDVVHGHYGPVGNGFRSIASMTEVPFVTSFYGYDASELLDKNPWRYEDLFRSSDTIASLSPQMDERLINHGCSQNKIVRFPLPVDTCSFQFSPTTDEEIDVIELLSVCRLVEKKGLRYVLEALSDLQNEYNIRYRIVGDGPLRSDLENRVSKRGLENIVSFEGWKSSEEVADLMSESHIFVQPSVTSTEGDQEGTPTVLLEAQARGMPVISTYHAGIPEIVDDCSSGILVPERDSSALESAFHELFSDPSQWKGYGKRGRELVEERHSLSAVATRLEEIYWGASLE